MGEDSVTQRGVRHPSEHSRLDDRRSRFSASSVRYWPDGGKSGSATHVDAGAADHSSLHDNGFLALFRQRPSEGFARDPATNNQVVELLNGHDELQLAPAGEKAFTAQSAATSVPMNEPTTTMQRA